MKWLPFLKETEEETEEEKEECSVDEELAATREKKKAVLRSIRTKTQEIRACNPDTGEGDPVDDANMGIPQLKAM